MQPLVTIGIPNYNYSHYITGALDSVAKQTYSNIEIIVVDDNSSDNSLAVINNWIDTYTGTFKITVLKNEQNKGLTKVCNQILFAANGKYFQTLDADDLLLPAKIEKQVALLEAEHDAAIIYSNIGVIDKDGNMIYDDYLAHIKYDKHNMPHGSVMEQLLSFNFIPLPSVLVNTARAREVGGFDETLQVQDYYLWLKLAEKYKIIYQQGTTALYRLHANSMSNSVTTNPKSIDSVLNIKYRYYKTSTPAIKQVIRKDIYNSAAYLYQLKYPTAPQWIRRNLVLNPSAKSLFYFTVVTLHIPFSLIQKLTGKVKQKK